MANVWKQFQGNIILSVIGFVNEQAELDSFIPFLHME